MTPSQKEELSPTAFQYVGQDEVHADNREKGNGFVQVACWAPKRRVVSFIVRKGMALSTGL